MRAYKFKVMEKVADNEVEAAGTYLAGEDFSKAVSELASKYPNLISVECTITGQKTVLRQGINK
jgi:hypothetical protein